jgi:excisionase family DNA binding protein
MSSNETLGRASYTVQEIAIRHGVHRSTVYRWLESGKLKSIKIGRNRRVTVKQEQDFLDLF